ncbi:MAG: hypothetical protein WCC12_11675 [Anaerolineales bacterium]
MLPPLRDTEPLSESIRDTGAEPMRLERIKVMELPGGRTHLEFHILK